MTAPESPRRAPRSSALVPGDRGGAPEVGRTSGKLRSALSFGREPGAESAEEPSAARAGEEAPPGRARDSTAATAAPTIGNPGLPLFSAESADGGGGAAGRGGRVNEGKLRKMFSWGRGGDAAGDGGAGQPPGGGGPAAATSSLVPAGYAAVFADRTPPLTRASGRAQWALKAVAVANNGLRRELADMYKMLGDFERRPLTLTTGDMDIFFSWFATFAAILRALFDLEERCLYAWVEGKDGMSAEDLKWCDSPDRIKGDLSEGRRMRQKGLILQHAASVGEFGSDAFAGRPVAERLGDLAETLDPLVTALVDYLAAKEEQLPGIVREKGLTARDRQRYEANYWASVPEVAGGSDLAGLVTVCATRWMGRRARGRWRRQYFTGMSRREYARCQQAYHTVHYSAVKELESRVTADECERLRAAAEHDALRARAAAAAAAGNWARTGMADLPADADDDESSATLSALSSE
jgi:hypothetical protein